MRVEVGSVCACVCVCAACVCARVCASIDIHKRLRMSHVSTDVLVPPGEVMRRRSSLFI